MNDLATVAVYTTRSDAEIVRARLVSEGIEAIVIADDEGGRNRGLTHGRVEFQEEGEEGEGQPRLISLII